MTKREARDALAEKLFMQALEGATGLGLMSPEEQAETYEQVADIALLMANRFYARAFSRDTDLV
jgi:hypothetical protein